MNQTPEAPAPPPPKSDPFTEKVLSDIEARKIERLFQREVSRAVRTLKNDMRSCYQKD